VKLVIKEESLLYFHYW